MSMSGVKLFQILKTKMGEREADALITYVDDSLHDNKKEFHEMMLSTFATKADLFGTKSELKEDIAGVKSELKADIAGVRTELKADIASVRTDLHKEIASVREDLAKVEGRLETKISDVKSDVLRWMFAFFVTMILAILGLYLKK